MQRGASPALITCPLHAARYTGCMLSPNGRWWSLAMICRVAIVLLVIGLVVTGNVPASARRAQREAGARAKMQAHRDQWVAQLKARGVEPWPEETEQDHAVALARWRKMVQEVIDLFPGMQLYETEHFLFTSNIPPEQVAPYVRYLDQMYDWMCDLYGVPAGTNVWLGGKAPIFAFLTHAEFTAFEQRHFQMKPEGLYGLCHQSSQGDVVIACFRGNNPNDFGQMLVHETSHGFIHRYKTKARLPSWVNEGMAELIGAEMVPRSDSVRRQESRAIMHLQQQPSLAGFFSAEPIQGWQYGVASSMNRFLLQSDRQAYVVFIEGLKDGLKWDEALHEAYGGTPEELVSQYGLWIGVPGLQP
jgi:hypothetical protein